MLLHLLGFILGGLQGLGQTVYPFQLGGFSNTDQPGHFANDQVSNTDQPGHFTNDPVSHTIKVDIPMSIEEIYTEDLRLYIEGRSNRLAIGSTVHHCCDYCGIDVTWVIIDSYTNNTTLDEAAKTRAREAMIELNTFKVQKRKEMAQERYESLLAEDFYFN